MAFFFLFYALWAQHVDGHEPCVRCIYQRSAMLFIAFGGLLSLSHYYLRPIGLLIVCIAGIFGLTEAHTHVGVMSGAIFELCPFFPDFKFFGRLDLQLPWFFEASGDCADDSWQLLGLNMPEWLRIVFANFIFFSIVLLIVWMMNWRKKLPKNASNTLSP